MTTLDITAGSLLRVAQILQAAADTAEIDTRTDPHNYLLEIGVNSLQWLCGSLLPDGVLIPAVWTESRSLAELLAMAEQELRSFPIAQYPVGTITLVVRLCDLIAEARGSSA